MPKKNKKDPWGTAADSPPAGGQDTSDLQDMVAEADLVQLNVRIPEQLHRRLKLHSVRTGQDMRAVVAGLLEKHLPE